MTAPARHLLSLSSAVLLGAALPAHAASFLSAGDIVRVSQGEMLQFQGKNMVQAPKGQEFTVLQYQAMQGIAYVAYYKPDGTLIAVTIPARALEIAPPNAWTDLLRGAEAFRDGRADEARRYLARAAQDQQYRPLAASINARITGYLAAATQANMPNGRQAFGAVVLGLREAAAELAKDGYLCLALPLDDVAERATKQLGNGQPIPALASKIDRDDLAKKTTISQRAVWRARQAISLKRLVEARTVIQAGLEAEPSRPELKAYEAKIAKDLKEADDSFEAADRMRKFTGGTPHALTALERGLKVCTDHPRLLALKKEMSGEFEGRTAPPVTPALLTAAHSSGPLAALEEGRKLYTSRCTECHDLELMDSRSVSGWEKAVGGMAGRAKLTDPEKARILEYITVAWNSLEGK